jgi:hypothetical protein
MKPLTLRITVVAFATAGLLSACAPYAHDIAPAPISGARYDGWSCSKLAKEQSFVDTSLTRVSADQDHSANNDALMVLLIGVPTSGGGVKSQVADLKGQQIAMHDEILQAECIR